MSLCTSICENNVLAKKSDTVAIAAGGTGGHVFPAQAVCEVLSKEYQVIWFIDERGKRYIEFGKITDYGEKYVLLKTSSLRRNFARKVLGLINIFCDIIRSVFNLRYNKVDVVLGFGGYPASPVLAAALFLGIPIILHEQNAVLGRVNRIFLKYAQLLAVSFEDTKLINPKYNNKIRYTGNPIRQSIIEAASSARNTDQAINIVIIGGSQGAKILCDVIPKAIVNLPEQLRYQMCVYQQVRQDLRTSVLSMYKNNVKKIAVQTFFDNIGELLSKADFVIARSGASTVAELTYLQKPSILVPLAIATDDHQYYNAMYLANKEAAIVIDEKNFTSHTLHKTLNKLFSGGRIDGMKKAARLLPQKNGTANLVKEINAILK
ncbi:UDP-N-acetylglucosamine--N-acetylmuramyl-(pentapeptide) pyrophosphoryl-undecaprenol N-acetylglucosamine transferase [Alphaproteobacteria bacterium]